MILVFLQYSLHITKSDNFNSTNYSFCDQYTYNLEGEYLQYTCANPAQVPRMCRTCWHVWPAQHWVSSSIRSNVGWNVEGNIGLFDQGLRDHISENFLLIFTASHNCLFLFSYFHVSLNNSVFFWGHVYLLACPKVLISSILFCLKLRLKRKLFQLMNKTTSIYGNIGHYKRACTWEKSTRIGFNLGWVSRQSTKKTIVFFKNVYL